MRRSTIIKQQIALEAIKKNYGVIQPALKSVGVGRTQFYHWRKSDTNFEIQYREMKTDVRIVLTSKLAERLNQGDPLAYKRITERYIENKRAQNKISP